MPDLFPSDASQAVGILASDISTKASEGMSAMVSAFGNTIPFVKASALSQSFTSLLSPSGLAKGIGGVIGSTFGTTGSALPTSVSAKLSASSGTTTSATAAKAQLNASSANTSIDYKVSLMNQQETTEILYFDVMPEITENRSVSYEAVSVAQSPGAFQKYKGTESTQWQLNATFVSRTTAEATRNLRYINMLRGWTMPYFGIATQAEFPNKIGAPPPTLLLNGYRGAGIVGPMPVVLTSLSWNWPNDVDYIPANAQDDADDTSPTIPFPVVMTVAMQFVESLSTAQFNQFDLLEFKLGKMIGAYAAPTSSTAGETGPVGSQPAQTVAPSSGKARDLALEDIATMKQAKSMTSVAQAAKALGLPAISEANVAAAVPVVVQKATSSFHGGH